MEHCKFGNRALCTARKISSAPILQRPPAVPITTNYLPETNLISTAIKYSSTFQNDVSEKKYIYLKDNVSSWFRQSLPSMQRAAFSWNSHNYPTWRGYNHPGWNKVRYVYVFYHHNASSNQWCTIHAYLTVLCVYLSNLYCIWVYLSVFE